MRHSFAHDNLRVYNFVICLAITQIQSGAQRVFHFYINFPNCPNFRHENLWVYNFVLCLTVINIEIGTQCLLLVFVHF